MNRVKSIALWVTGVYTLITGLFHIIIALYMSTPAFLNARSGSQAVSFNSSIAYILRMLPDLLMIAAAIILLLLAKNSQVSVNSSASVYSDIKLKYTITGVLLSFEALFQLASSLFGGLSSVYSMKAFMVTGVPNIDISKYSSGFFSANIPIWILYIVQLIIGISFIRSHNHTGQNGSMPRLG